MREDLSRSSLAAQRELTFGQQPETNGPRGLLVWVVAAAALVAGIVIGFTSGYAAGQRNLVGIAPVPAAETAEPAVAAPSPEQPAQAFSEAAVPEPPRVDPEPIVLPEETEDRPNRSDRAVRPGRSNAQRTPNVSKAANAASAPAVPRDANDSRPGSMEVLSRPAGAQVIVDGRVVGRTPLSIAGMAPGPHSVRLELPGFNRWATSVEVTPGARTRVAASLEQP